MAAKSPGAIASRVIGNEVVVLAPEASKFSRYSPLLEPLLDSVAKLGARFSYEALPSLPAAEKYATPFRCV